MLYLAILVGIYAIYKAICNFGSRNYTIGYGNSHAGDSSMFSVVLVLLLLGGLIVWSQIP